MTDLTEQWEKGELPVGEYYLLYKDGTTDREYYDWANVYGRVTEKGFSTDTNDIEKILAPVPSYDEWQSREKYNKHLEEVIKVYERKDKQATETSIAYNELSKENEELKEILERHKKATAKAQMRSCDLEIINAQLKELLKECIPALVRFVSYDDSDENARILLMNKINEVLK